MRLWRSSGVSGVSGGGAGAATSGMGSNGGISEGGMASAGMARRGPKRALPPLAAPREATRIGRLDGVVVGGADDGGGGGGGSGCDGRSGDAGGGGGGGGGGTAEVGCVDGDDAAADGVAAFGAHASRMRSALPGSAASRRAAASNPAISPSRSLLPPFPTPFPFGVWKEGWGGGGAGWEEAGTAGRLAFLFIGPLGVWPLDVEGGETFHSSAAASVKRTSRAAKVVGALGVCWPSAPGTVTTTDLRVPKTGSAGAAAAA